MDPARLQRLLHGNPVEQQMVWTGATRNPDGTINLAEEAKSWVDKTKALWQSRNFGRGEEERAAALFKGLEEGTIRQLPDGTFSYSKPLSEVTDPITQIVALAAEGQAPGGAATTIAGAAEVGAAPGIRGGGLQWILSPQGVGNPAGLSSVAPQVQSAVGNELVANQIQQRLDAVLAAPVEERLHVASVAATALGLDPGQAILHSMTNSGAQPEQVFEALGIGMDDLARAAEANAAAVAPEVVAGAETVAEHLPQAGAVAEQLLEHAPQLAPVVDRSAELATQLATQLAERSRSEVDFMRGMLAGVGRNEGALTAAIEDLAKASAKIAATHV